jgi:hypothetical protein
VKKLSFLIPLLLLLLSVPAYAYKFASGSYTGNGSDSRSIVISTTTSPAITDFQPDFCIVKQSSAATGQGVVRSSSMAGDLTFDLSGNSAANIIQALNSTGFEVGTAAQSNSSGETYRYVCLASDASNDLAVGSYSGNDSDGRQITISPLFTPAMVMIWSTAAEAYWTNDTSLISKFTGTQEGSIVYAMNSSGFTVSSNFRSNASGTTYYYLAIKAVTGGTATGSYTGNGSDNRSISGLGFQPEFMWITSNVIQAAARFLTNSGDSSEKLLEQTAATANLIQTFESDGFQLGTDNHVNANTSLYRWFAIKASPGGGGGSPTVRHRVIQ